MRFQAKPWSSDLAFRSLLFRLPFYIGQCILNRVPPLSNGSYVLVKIHKWSSSSWCFGSACVHSQKCMSAAVPEAHSNPECFITKVTMDVAKPCIRSMVYGCAWENDDLMSRRYLFSDHALLKSILHLWTSQSDRGIFLGSLRRCSPCCT